MYNKDAELVLLPVVFQNIVIPEWSSACRRHSTNFLDRWSKYRTAVSSSVILGFQIGLACTRALESSHRSRRTRQILLSFSNRDLLTPFFNNWNALRNYQFSQLVDRDASFLSKRKHLAHFLLCNRKDINHCKSRINVL